MPSVLLEWGDDLAVRATVHGDLRTSDLRILGHALLDASESWRATPRLRPQQGAHTPAASILALDAAIEEADRG